MTGDGVNDALALKDADIGVAMGSGAPATRAVAQVVLLDGQFASMPGVVAEGRRVIANVERVANLFVTKTVYAMLLAIAVGIARWPYPFLPRHLTIVSSLTIGIPAFFLALAPNPRRYVPGLRAPGAALRRPGGRGRGRGDVRVVRDRARALRRSRRSARTAATITLLIVGLWVLNLLARPITPGRALLVRRDGRRVRRDPRGAGAARLVRARAAARRGDVGRGAVRRGGRAPCSRSAGRYASGGCRRSCAPRVGRGAATPAPARAQSEA